MRTYRQARPLCCVFILCSTCNELSIRYVDNHCRVISKVPKLFLFPKKYRNLERPSYFIIISFRVKAIWGLFSAYCVFVSHRTRGSVAGCLSVGDVPRVCVAVLSVAPRCWCWCHVNAVTTVTLRHRRGVTQSYAIFVPQMQAKALIPSTYRGA